MREMELKNYAAGWSVVPNVEGCAGHEREYQREKEMTIHTIGIITASAAVGDPEFAVQSFLLSGIYHYYQCVVAFSC